MNIILEVVRVTSGPTYEYLKSIDLVGRVEEEGDFVVFGCKKDHESQFYNGVLEMDKSNPIFGLQSVEETKEFWLDGGDGTLLYIEKGCFERVDINAS